MSGNEEQERFPLRYEGYVIMLGCKEPPFMAFSSYTGWAVYEQVYM